MVASSIPLPKTPNFHALSSLNPLAAIRVGSDELRVSFLFRSFSLASARSSLQATFLLVSLDENSVPSSQTTYLPYLVEKIASPWVSLLERPLQGITAAAT